MEPDWLAEAEYKLKMMPAEAKELRALGVKAMFDLALDGEKPNYQASQFLVKDGWFNVKQEFKLRLWMNSQVTCRG